jgi:serine phosphatase RsbU (regulator of sigma subunit)
MLFRRKKGAGKGEPEPEKPAAPAKPAAGGSGEAGPGAGGEATTRFLTGESRRDRRSVQVLLDAIAGVSAHHDLEVLLPDIVDRSIEVTGAERGLLLLAADGGDLEVRVARSREGGAIEGELRYSTSVAKRVLEREEPVRATVNTDSEALDLGRSVFDLKLRAVMCVPLAASSATGGAQGVLYVDSRAATRQFDEGDLSLFAALAQHIAIALQNARMHMVSLENERLSRNAELAGAIQQTLMPDLPGELDDWDVHGWYRPAEEAAGDFYDFVATDDGRMAVIVGDASGHGIGPALITAHVQGSMASLLGLLPELDRVLTKVNRDLARRIEAGRFVTLSVALLGADGAIERANAGHTPPLVWRAATGEVHELTGGSPALGMIDDFPYECEESLRLESGDVLVILTDGVTEARAPGDEEVELFGVEGVREVLCEHAPKADGARDIALRLAEAALTLAAGRRDDDMTVVVVRKR